MTHKLNEGKVLAMQTSGYIAKSFGCGVGSVVYLLTATDAVAIRYTAQQDLN